MGLASRRSPFSAFVNYHAGNSYSATAAEVVKLGLIRYMVRQIGFLKLREGWSDWIKVEFRP